jgi:hypothetical protein
VLVVVRQKKILGFCPNFDEIVNCDFLEDDILTQKLIQYYQDFVFSINEQDEDDIKFIQKLDAAMYKYIEDYRFAKKLKETLNVAAVIDQEFTYLEQLMRYIINFFAEYELQEVRHIFHSKWI